MRKKKLYVYLRKKQKLRKLICAYIYLPHIFILYEYDKKGN